MTHYTSTTTTFDASQGGQVQVTTKRSRRAGAKWTRSGCLTCKRRRKRCDETKPSCSNCVRLGMACEGYGSMWAKPLNPSAQVFQQSMPPKRQRLSASPCSSGPPAGRTSPCPDFSGYPPSCVPSSSSLNADGKEDRPFDAKTRNLSRTTNDGSDAARIDHLEVVPLKPSSNITHLSHLEAHYLQYHMVQGSKLMVNLESDENPLRSLLIPRACSSPLVMNALCAVSAVHLANRTHNSLDAQTAATNYYIQTMSGLRSILSAASGRGYPEETILAVALLCKYEIVRGSVKQWEMHLDALERLVISRGGFASFDEDMTEFLWGLFLYAHNMAKITSRRQFTAISAAETVNISKLDTYVGYTEELIKTCARIADLPLLSCDPVALGLEIHAIDMSLRDWTPTVTKYAAPKGITESTLLRLRLVAECFRDAAYIFLHTTLDKMSRKFTSQNLASLWPSLITLSKGDALECLLERIKSVSLDQHCEYSALTFPLFITGCETGSPASRDLVIRSLSKLEVNFGIGNVKRAKELLHILWEGEETHWLDVLERLNWGLILA